MASKRIVDLTSGGTCDRCDAEPKCAVCGAAGELLYYAQSGDHDHLVNYHGQLGREAHGVLVCAKHEAEDRAAFEAKA